MVKQIALSLTRQLNNCKGQSIKPLNLLFSTQTKMPQTNCIFCKIVQKTEPTELLYEDDSMVVFKDIKPATKFHFLAVTKDHIPSAKTLTLKDKPLLETLISNGKKVITEQGGNVDDLLMGFHWPPFNSVMHLHLHLISPASEMGFFARNVFRPNTFWFVTPEYVLEHLKSKM